ncbi:flagellar basal body P-ring formation chaperone FlgA [Ferrimonas lipolytica]|uniref:Flagella basal body P-ring formation protein FlgA n=1 Tax=Ferrimonas lipolytica TaxID=2724191 RepID=A0A6H1UCK2_9GAMM|nr:flagellar basal body P-ring formation chaperone FlgA [Ferrimonas lipolytica]QIZ76791.1 flagellar basal body P-ring formation protein FlgA [Ferrimonas lipolytica]
MVAPSASAASAESWLKQQFDQQLLDWKTQQQGVWGETRLQFGRRTAPLPSCSGSLRLAKPLTGTPLGTHRVNLSCDQPLWERRVRVTYQAKVQVWMTQHELPRNQIISATDIQPKQQWVDDRSDRLVLDKQQIIGHRATRRIAANSAIKAMVIADAWMVSKGQEVVISAKQGGFTATTKGVALSSANQGQVIKVKNSRSGKVISAYVIDFGVVETKF